MSAQCQNCGGKSADAFLCRTCVGELRQMLADLPWWIDRLAEAAVGHAKLGDGGRHTRSEPEGLVEYADPVEGDERLERAMASGKFGRDRVLAAGKVNARASRLLDRVQNSLTTIVRDVCESRGVDLPPSVAVAPKTGVGACTRIAKWLGVNVDVLAGGDGAGVTFGEIRHLVGDGKRDGEIAKLINRPIPPRFCGVCDTEVDRKECRLALYARREAIEVTCPKCRTTHNVERLFNRTMNQADYKRFTREELIGNQRTNLAERYTTGIMGELGEFVHWQAFHHWTKERHLKPAGYQRPDGRRGVSRHSDGDVPEYRLADVRSTRRKMAERTGKAKAG